MGTAQLTCEGGCHCTPKIVDAHEPKWHASPMAYASLTVSESDACVISVVIPQGTRSGGHKFKVCGMIMAVDQRNSEMTGHVINGVHGVNEGADHIVRRVA